MSPEERSEYLVNLDDELLRGSAMLSEWSVFLIRSADAAFIAGADLAAILCVQAAIESHLRFEYGGKGGFHSLIEGSPLSAGLRSRLHELRRFRNGWVHVNDPQADEDLLAAPAVAELELEVVVIAAVRLLREVMYLEQGI